MASFGGASIFGTAISMITADNPREKQINAFFGLSGLESLDGGLRGRVTRVTGLLYGLSPALLASAEAAFRSFNDGKARILVDTLGVSWADNRVKMWGLGESGEMSFVVATWHRSLSPLYGYKKSPA